MGRSRKDDAMGNRGSQTTSKRFETGGSGNPSDEPKAALDLSLERARGCLALYADGLSLNSLPCCTQSQAELEI